MTSLLTDIVYSIRTSFSFNTEELKLVLFIVRPCSVTLVFIYSSRNKKKQNNLIFFSFFFINIILTASALCSNYQKSVAQGDMSGKTKQWQSIIVCGLFFFQNPLLKAKQTFKD